MQCDTVNVAVIDALICDADHGPGTSACRYVASIANRPLIAHVVDTLAASGIDKILVLSHQELRTTLMAALASSAAADVKVDVECIGADPHRCGSFVSRLHDVAGDSPIVLHSGDCLFPADIGRLEECFYGDALDLAVLVGGDREPGLHPLELMPRAHVRLPRQDPQGTAVILGPEIWPALDGLGTEPLCVPSAIASLTAAGRRIGACEVGEHWCYSECSERLLAANQMLLDALPLETCSRIPGQGNSAQGRVSVSPSARISRSTLRGPVLIGGGATVEDSFVGPYTAIAPGATVVGAELDYTMVLANAQVRHPGYRLEASVIGERAIVRHSFSFPVGMHLRIGPDAQVTLG